MVGLLLFFAFRILPSIPWALLMLLPLIVDGIVQARTTYESTNLRRLITGILYGYGLPSFIVQYYLFCYRIGYGLTY